MTTGDGASLATQAAEQAVKAAIPVGTTGALIFGVPVADWVMIFTLVYTVLQLAALLYGWFTKWKARHGGT